MPAASWKRSRAVAAVFATAAVMSCASARTRDVQPLTTSASAKPCQPGNALQVHNGSGEAIRIIGAKSGYPPQTHTEILLSVPRGRSAIVTAARSEMDAIYAAPIDNPTLPNNAPRAVQHVEFRCIADSVAFRS